MKFILRDDDTCFFTTPEQLTTAFGDVWAQGIPVSLAVIPFVGGSLYTIVPEEYRHSDKTFAIGDNVELVSFLKQCIAEKKVSIMLHGYSHTDYPNGYEFGSQHDWAKEVKKGREYLEELFGVTITTFVPPHNTLDEMGWKSVISNGLDISGIPNFRPNYKRLCYPYFWPIFLKKIWHKTISGYTYPFPINIGTHTEYPYFSLTSSVPYKKLQKALAYVHKKNGFFCLAGHYTSYQTDTPSKRHLKQFIEELKTYDATEYIYEHRQ